VIESESKAQPGTHLVRDKGYATLLDRAQRIANERGTAVTVRGDKAHLISPSAVSAWKGLKAEGYAVKTTEGVPSVTFQPSTPIASAGLPKSLGGASLPEHQFMPWMSNRK
jgi:hypothetical protein